MKTAQASRPAIPVPREIAGLVSVMQKTFHSTEIWLFGSRARGTASADSDWDLLVVLDDDAAERLSNPELVWRVSRDSDVRSTILATTRQDLQDIWGFPNTLGYDLACEGIRLLVG
jgi:hypothetical protein